MQSPERRLHVEHSLTEAVKVEEPAAALPQSRSGTQATILLVEDEDFVRAVTREVLLVAGYKVLAACHIGEALDIFARSEETISLVLADHKLPGGDGWSLAQQLIAAQPEMKAIIISGYPQNQTEPKQAGKGGIAYLAKPFSTETLVGTVRKVLEASEPPPLVNSAVAS